MKEYKGRVIAGGHYKGEAAVSHQGLLFAPLLSQNPYAYPSLFHKPLNFGQPLGCNFPADIIYAF